MFAQAFLCNPLTLFLLQELLQEASSDLPNWQNIFNDQPPWEEPVLFFLCPTLYCTFSSYNSCFVGMFSIMVDVEHNFF